MALGSSAPEILLSVIETIGGLGKCPGELGASTIVGSAAFNLLVISAVSIYAVSEANDTDEDRDTSVPVGVKKIYDMGVFSVTCTWSMWAYIWLFLVVKDNTVDAWEAWVTFAFFFILIGMSYAADRYKARQDESNKDELVEADGMAHYVEYKPLEIYKELMNEKRGIAANDKESVEKRQKMKEIIKSYQKTDNIEQVKFEEFKKQIEGDSMIGRIKYRKAVGNLMHGKRPVVAKGEIMKQEHAHADLLDEKVKNPNFGFKCLHYSVSEASGSI
jgi:solute carrier family 8 (sodium/calcium exchanger)